MRRAHAWFLVVGTVALAAGACGDDGGDVPVKTPASADASASSTDGAAGAATPTPAPAPTDAGGTGQEFSGEATYYDADGTGACGQRTSSTALVAAINDEQYDRSVCGKCASVTGPKGTVVVKILDRCPGCDRGDLDLSEAAFAKIAALSAGRVRITWRFVTCP